MQVSADFQPSAFITAIGAEFVRSKIALYAAIILDVKHNTTTGPKDGTMPEGYPTMLANVAELDEKLSAKYCGIIGKALQGRYADKLNDYPADSLGLDLFVAWIETNARAEGYTLSLEDLKFFFSGKLSMKAQAKALEQAQADAEAERQKKEAQRAAEGAAKSAEDKAKKEASDAAAQATENALASIPMPAKQGQQETEVGKVVIGQQGAVWSVTVSEAGQGHHVNIPDAMTDGALEALLSSLLDTIAQRADAAGEAKEIVANIQAGSTATAA